MAELTTEEKEAKRLRELEAAAQEKDSDSPVSKFFNLIFKFLESIFGNFFSLDNNEAPDEDETPGAKPDTVADIVRMGKLIIEKRAIPKWREFQRNHAEEVVTHESPVAGKAAVGSPFDPDRLHPIHNVKKPHVGADITAQGNPDIHPSARGTVLFSGKKSGYGYTVIVGHSDGSSTLYAHLTGDKMPDIGALVEREDVIGVLGASGRVTGAHLHYEQRLAGGRPVPPRINGQLLDRGVALNNGTATFQEKPRHDHGDDAPQVAASRAPVSNPVPNLHPTAANAAVAAVSFKPPKSAHREQPTYGNGTFEVSDVKDAVAGAANTVFAKAKTAFNGLFA